MLFKRLFLSIGAISLLLSAVALSAIAAPAPSSGDWEVLKTIRVLNQNIYGRQEKNCGERYRTQARNILNATPPYDVVSLNEHWKSWVGRKILDQNCNSALLEHALFVPGSPFLNSPGASRTRLSYPRGNLALARQNGGGNSVLTPHRITGFRSFVYSNSNRIPLVGYMLTQIELAPGLTLDLWTTHLEATSDDCTDLCRRNQLEEFARTVAKYSATSGNPVLLAGDFNMGGPLGLKELEAHLLDGETFPYTGKFPSPQRHIENYDYFMSLFKNPRDLWIEHLQLNNDRKTEGATWDPRLNILSDGRFGARIDYLFIPRHGTFQNSANWLRLKNIEVVRWKTADGTPVSDHFGLDATLEIVRKK